MEKEIFLQNILTSSGAHSVPLQWVPGAPSPGVVGGVGNLSLHSNSVESKNECSCTFISPYALMASTVTALCHMAI